MKSNPEPMAVGIDLGGTNIRLGIVNPAGDLSETRSFPTQPHEGPESIINRMHKAFLEITGDHSGPVAAGLGAPGPLNSRTGIVESMPNLPGWEHYPLRDELHARLGCPVYLLNDADAFAWCEFRTGHAKSVDSFAMITLGTGLGSSLILNGKLWVGSSGMSPELGHIPISEVDDICGCGCSGHLESFVSSRAIRTRIRSAVTSGRETCMDIEKLLLSGFSIRKIAKYAQAGDAVAIEELNRYARYLGRGLAVLANLLNLELVVVSGGVSGAWTLLEPVVRRELDTQAFPLQASTMRIMVSQQSEWGGAIGAGLWALEACKTLQNTVGDV